MVGNWQVAVRARPTRAGLLAVIALAMLPLAACSDEGRLILNTESGAHAFAVEVVDTAETRARGLMFRQELADDAGMLFDFKEEREVSFWMMNTLIPLDMIFIGADGVVKTVHVNARPQDPTSIPSQVPVQFVLEIPGGRSEEIGLEPGDTVEHPRIGSKAP
ncbi:DUF192 domain-containing protein [Devosia nitrariae]|uniref:DUF192 domain-containing protein n=1 Tax=Devosia nitrariae TaxID=2071872 RepID=A0ABQ5WDR5_9HYPH|nr:DUF192 domain-containing protein [Devosia nitrariae]GLQ57863.1 hypothetical protein GCM10010862_51220 [Devosia nitrariae]